MKEKELTTSIMEAVEKPIETAIKSGVNLNNLDYLYKLVDIYKDVANINYWKVKEDNMRYSNYGNYGRGGSYGRRGYDARYRGHRPEDKIDEMYMNYQAYSEGREAYGRGNYGAREDSMMCLETMLESMEDFVKMLKEEASSQEEIELIRKYIKKISEM